MMTHWCKDCKHDIRRTDSWQSEYCNTCLRSSYDPGKSPIGYEPIEHKYYSETQILDALSEVGVGSGDTDEVISYLRRSYFNEPNKPGGMVGWTCPVCGRGLSPFTTVCPCKDKWEVTC